MRNLFYKFAGPWKRFDLSINPIKTYSILFLLSYLFISSNTFAQFTGLVQTQDISAQENTNLAKLTEYHPNNSQWVHVDEGKIVSEPGVSYTFSAMSPFKASGDLDQTRNGSATSRISPANWVNGNAGASNAHYAEGWSIPYRLVLTGLSLGSHTVIIEWDTKQSGTNAIDFITQYNLLDNPVGSHVATFGHDPETIDPTIGITGLSTPVRRQIPTPTLPTAPLASFVGLSNDDPAISKTAMTLYNVSDATLTYASEGSLANATATTQLQIVFTATNATVVLSWGGHIGSFKDWGLGNSASAISGSPYHTRFLELDGSGGNQDRSLSAEAVIDPPQCDISGPVSVTCNSTGNTYTYNGGALDPTYTYTWTLNPANGASIVGSSVNVSSISVTAGSSCANGYTVVLTITKNGSQIGAPCTVAVSVVDNTPPTISASGATLAIAGCNPSSADINAALGSATATDACSTPSVAVTNSAVTGLCSKSQTRTFTATDACGNTATTSRTATWTADITAPTITASGTPTNGSLGCNPTSAVIESALGSATATDACGNPTVSSSTGNVTSNGCSRSQTRTFTATDGCGNTATASRTATWTADVTAPTITATGSSTALDCNPTTAAIDGVLGSATATDACGNPSVSTSTGNVTSNGCSRSQTRTFTATDGCGNTATTSRTATWTEDHTPPTLNCPGDVHLQCMSASTDPGGALGSASATDACGTPTIGHSDVVSGTACNRKLITRTWTATDACGNTASCVQHIIVADNTPPTITCNTGGAAPTVTDNCSSTANITVFHSGDAWTAIDEAGNISTLTCTGSGTVARISSSSTSEIVESQTSVKAYPNPFSDRVKFVVTSSVAGRGNLEVYNMMGQKIKTVYQGFILKGTQTFELSLPTQQISNLIYVLRVGDKKMSGKLLQINQ